MVGLRCELRVDMREFLACFLAIEHPSDLRSAGIAAVLPVRDFRLQFRPLGNPPVKALRPKHCDLNLYHVEPAGVFGNEVKLDLAQHPPCLGGSKVVV